MGVAAAGVVAGGWLLAVARNPVLNVDEILAKYEQTRSHGRLAIRHPFDGALFPRDIAAPTVSMGRHERRCGYMGRRVRPPKGRDRMSFEARATEWTPSPDDWERIKCSSLDGSTKVTVLGLRLAHPDAILSAASLSFCVSAHEVGAPIFYREVNLPFIEAVKDRRRSAGCCGAVSSREPPPVVLDKAPRMWELPFFFGRGGRSWGWTWTTANDKASYAILPVRAEMELEPSQMITWDDYRREDRQPTFGLLSQVSPDGRYVVSTGEGPVRLRAAGRLGLFSAVLPHQGSPGLLRPEHKAV